MIKVDSISCRVDAFSLGDINFSIPTGSYGVLMGDTGSGKTTLLEIICGLRRPNAGRVWLEGQDVTHLAPGKRGIGYVPQDGALFPTMTVRQHLGFILRVRKAHRDTITHRVDELAAQLGIAPLLDRPPQGLSGGERQRVALGRALAARPRILLLDEPLSALDDERRHQLAEMLSVIQRQEKLTVLHVTHHRQEALKLADVLFRLEQGRILEPNTAGNSRKA